MSKPEPKPPLMGLIWLHTPTQAGAVAQLGQSSPTKPLGFIFTLFFMLFSPLQKQQQQNLKTCKAAEHPPSSPRGWGEHPPTPRHPPPCGDTDQPWVRRCCRPHSQPPPALTAAQLQLGASLRREPKAESCGSAPLPAGPVQPAGCLAVCLASAQPLPASPRIAISGLLCKRLLQPQPQPHEPQRLPGATRGWW